MQLANRNTQGQTCCGCGPLDATLAAGNPSAPITPQACGSLAEVQMTFGRNMGAGIVGASPMDVGRSVRERQVAQVPLGGAATQEYYNLHRILSAKNEAALNSALNDAALALAQIAGIYYENAGRILRIPDDDLRSGLFSDGAKTFKSTAGHQFKSLSMRRVDVMHAMEVLEQGSQSVSSRHDDEHEAVARDASARRD